MCTLTRMTEFLKGNSDLLKLLKEKIEKCILDDKSVCVCMDNCSMSCRNKINIEDYEINNNYLYLNDKNFEVHIDFDKDTSIIYEDAVEECFTIMQNDMEFNMCFL